MRHDCSIRFSLALSVAFCISVCSAAHLQLRTERARCVVDERGARVLSLVIDGQELLWNAEPLQTDAPVWAHGGIPFCWPWFGADAQGQLHGYAWRRNFALTERSTTSRQDTVVLTLKETTSVVALRLTLTDSLTLAATVRNTGTNLLMYTMGFHPYFRTADVRNVVVEGLEELAFEDDPSFAQPEKGVWSGPFAITQACDRIFAIAPTPRKNVVRGIVPDKVLQLTFDRFTDINVWNPWGTQAPGMLGPNDWKHFVCVEPVRYGDRGVVQLMPGQAETQVFSVGVIQEEKTVK